MESNKYFNLDSVKRYFHMIAFRADKNYSAKDFLKDSTCRITKKNQLFDNNISFSIQEAELISNIPYYNGEQDFSLNKNENAPYKYDIFAIQLPNLNIFIIGFPFKLLAKATLNTLLTSKKLLSKGSFVKCNINKLLKDNVDSEMLDSNFLSYFSGLDLTLTKEDNISSVNLDGDKPLESQLYKTVFLELVNKDECHLERCAIKCLLQSNFENLPRTKSNVHMDVFGNYKFYLHTSAKNIFTLPFLFHYLDSKKCLEDTLSNPIERLNDE